MRVTRTCRHDRDLRLAYLGISLEASLAAHLLLILGRTREFVEAVIELDVIVDVGGDGPDLGELVAGRGQGLERTRNRTAPANCPSSWTTSSAVSTVPQRAAMPVISGTWWVAPCQ